MDVLRGLRHQDNACAYMRKTTGQYKERSVAQQWLSIVEYARAYNISDMTIRRRIKTGKLSATLKDGKYFIPVDIENLPKRDSEPSSHHEPPRPSSHQGAAAPGHHRGPHAHNYPPTPFPAQHYPREAAHTQSAEPPPSSPEWIHKSASPRQGSPAEGTGGDGEVMHAHRRHIPHDVAANLVKASPTGVVSVSSQKLLHVCDELIQQWKLRLDDVTKSYDNKLLYLEKSLEMKDAKITELQQKIEDLELLIKIFEAKKGEVPAAHEPLQMNPGPAGAQVLPSSA